MSENTKPDGGPAFPSRGGHMFYLPETARGTIEDAVKQLDQYHSGLTLRDFFAAKALPAILAQDESGINAYSPGGHFRTNGTTAAQYWAESAYQIADAMIAARSKA